MQPLGILSIFLCVCLVWSSSSSSADNVIYVNEIAGKTIRLKSVLSLMSSSTSTTPASILSTTHGLISRTREDSELLSQRHRQQKIFWSVKRLYAVPSWTNGQGESKKTSAQHQTSEIIRTLNELSQVENMISLDAEVEHKLQAKYSTTNDSAVASSNEDDSMYDLTIFNLNYADSGVYKCNLWNQRTIYYKLIVSSKIFKLTFHLFIN